MLAPKPLVLGLHPELAEDLPSEEQKAWFPVAGMYGGFAYWLAPDHNEPALIVESWSRMAEDSGMRHLILPSGFVLTDSL